LKCVIAAALLEGAMLNAITLKTRYAIAFVEGIIMAQDLNKRKTTQHAWQGTYSISMARTMSYSQTTVNS
jgi:hypothetical protein